MQQYARIRVPLLVVGITSLSYVGCNLKEQFSHIASEKFQQPAPAQGSDSSQNSDQGRDSTTPPPLEVGGGKAPPAGGSQADPCIAAATCPTGKWINVTPPEMHPDPGYGIGGIVVDPKRPTDMYAAGGSQGLWKSTDYGATWKLVNTQFGYNPHGVTLAVAGTDPEATVWVAGYRVLHKSTNGGKNFERIDVTTSHANMDLYSFQVDPYDPTHLISGFHEADGVYESTDGGRTWKEVGISGANWSTGGISWYPYFIDTGIAASTRSYWFAIAQNGGQPSMTLDGGKHWFYPSGISNLVHPHGTSQIYQTGGTLYVSGEGSASGAYRSTNVLDPGTGGDKIRFTRLPSVGASNSGDEKSGVIWGTPKAIYSMYGWACGTCDLNEYFWVGSLLEPTFAMKKVSLGDKNDPNTFRNGPNNVAVTSDGKHHIFIGSMWSSGVWRYIEP